MKMSRNAAKAGASRGDSGALSAQSCVESTLGMTQSSDSAVDQIMNNQQTLSNQVLGGVQSTRDSLTTPYEKSSPLGGSSDSFGIRSEVDKYDKKTSKDASSGCGDGGGAATGGGAADSNDGNYEPPFGSGGNPDLIPI